MNDNILSNLVTILLYLLVYNVVLLNLFALFLPLPPTIDSMYAALFSHSHSIMNPITIITLFSLAGVPPFAGFFANVSLISLLFTEFFFTWFLILIPLLLFSIFFYLSNLRGSLSLAPITPLVTTISTASAVPVAITVFTVFGVAFFDDIMVALFWIIL